MELDEIEKLLKKEPETAARDLLKKVEELYGEVPYILEFMKDTPELLVTKILYDNAIIRENKRLDPRTIELISIAVAAALRCSHCLKMHIRVARRMGIPKEEIFDAILIAGSLSNASVLAEGTRAIDSEKDCGNFEKEASPKDQDCGACKISIHKNK